MVETLRRLSRWATPSSPVIRLLWLALVVALLVTADEQSLETPIALSKLPNDRRALEVSDQERAALLALAPGNNPRPILVSTLEQFTCEEGSNMVIRPIRLDTKLPLNESLRVVLNVSLTAPQVKGLDTSEYLGTMRLPSSYSSWGSQVKVASGAYEGGAAYTFVGQFEAMLDFLRQGIPYHAAADAWKQLTLHSVKTNLEFVLSAEVQVLNMGNWLPVGRHNETSVMLLTRRKRKPSIIVTPMRQVLATNQPGYFSASVIDSSGLQPPGIRSVRISCLYGSIDIPRFPESCWRSTPENPYGLSTVLYGTTPSSACVLSGSPQELDKLLANVSYLPRRGYSWIEGLEKVTFAVTDSPGGFNGSAPVNSELTTKLAVIVQVNRTNWAPEVFLSTEPIQWQQDSVVMVDSIPGISPDSFNAAISGGAMVQSDRLSMAVYDLNLQDSIRATVSASSGTFVLGSQFDATELLASLETYTPPSWATNIVTSYDGTMQALASQLKGIHVTQKLTRREDLAKSNFTFSGPYNYVNRLLERLVYVPMPGFRGIATVTVTAVDDAGLRSQKNATVVLAPQDKLPYLSSPRTVNVKEDVSVLLLEHAKLSNLDETSLPSRLVKVIVRAYNGVLLAPLPTLIAGGSSNNNSSGIGSGEGAAASKLCGQSQHNTNTSEFCIIGYPGAVQSTISSLVFYPALNFFSPTPTHPRPLVQNQDLESHALVLCTVDSYDVINGPLNSPTAVIVEAVVVPVNDLPTVAQPSEVFLYEDVPGAALLNVTIDDVDGSAKNGFDEVWVNVTAALGSVSLSNGAAELNEVQLSSAAGVMILYGTLAAVNRALAAVLYSSPSNFNGNDFITLTVFDGGSAWDVVRKNVDLVVLPVNDLPALAAPYLLRAVRGGPAIPFVVNLTDPDFHMDHIARALLTASVTVEGMGGHSNSGDWGSVFLVEGKGDEVAFQLGGEGALKALQSIVFSGPIHGVKRALENLAFKPPPQVGQGKVSTAGRLVVVVSDRGHFGAAPGSLPFTASSVAPAPGTGLGTTPEPSSTVINFVLSEQAAIVIVSSLVETGGSHTPIYAVSEQDSSLGALFSVRAASGVASSSLHVLLHLSCTHGTLRCGKDCLSLGVSAIEVVDGAGLVLSGPLGAVQQALPATMYRPQSAFNVKENVTALLLAPPPESLQYLAGVELERWLSEPDQWQLLSSSSVLLSVLGRVPAPTLTWSALSANASISGSKVFAGRLLKMVEGIPFPLSLSSPSSSALGKLGSPISINIDGSLLAAKSTCRMVVFHGSLLIAASSVDLRSATSELSMDFATLAGISVEREANSTIVSALCQLFSEGISLNFTPVMGASYLAIGSAVELNVTLFSPTSVEPAGPTIGLLHRASILVMAYIRPAPVQPPVLAVMNSRIRGQQAKRIYLSDANVTVSANDKNALYYLRLTALDSSNGTSIHAPIVRGVAPLPALEPGVRTFRANSAALSRLMEFLCIEASVPGMVEVSVSILVVNDSVSSSTDVAYFSLVEVANQRVFVDVAKVLRPASVRAAGRYIHGSEDTMMCPEVGNGLNGPFSGFSVSCEDNRLIVFSLTLAAGTVGFPEEHALEAASNSGYGWTSVLRVNGSAADVTSVLTKLCFQPPAHGNVKTIGAFPVTATALDTVLNKTSSLVMQIVLASVNDAPEISVGTQPSPDADNDNVLTRISFSHVTVVDVDDDLLLVKLSVLASQGKWKFSTFTPFVVAAIMDPAMDASSGETISSVWIRGPRSHVNTVMQSILYLDLLQAEVGHWMQRSITANVSAFDSSAQLSTTGPASIPTVLSMRSVIMLLPEIASVISIDHSSRSIRSREGSSVNVSGFAITGFPKTVVVTVEVACFANGNGDLATSLSFEGLKSSATVFGSSLTIKGTAEEINAKFAILVVTPSENFNGIVNVTSNIISAIDPRTRNPRAMSGRREDFVFLLVSAVNTPPTIRLEGPAKPGFCRLGPECSLPLLINDIDAGESVCSTGTAGTFTLTVKVTAPANVNASASIARAVLPPHRGVFLYTGYRVESTSVFNSSFSSSPFTITTTTISLRQAIYNGVSLLLNIDTRVPPGFAGLDSNAVFAVSVVVSDSGACGSGGAMNASATSSVVLRSSLVSVTAHAQADLGSTIAYANCAEDEACRIPSLVLQNLGLASSRNDITLPRGVLLQITLTPRFGAVVVSSRFNAIALTAMGLAVNTTNTSLVLTSANSSALAVVLSSLIYNPRTNFNGIWNTTAEEFSLELIAISVKPISSTGIVDETTAEFLGTTESSFLRVSVAPSNDAALISAPASLDISIDTQGKLPTAGYLLSDPFTVSSPSIADSRRARGQSARSFLRGVVSITDADADSSVPQTASAHFAPASTAYDLFLNFTARGGSLFLPLSTAITAGLSRQAQNFDTWNSTGGKVLVLSGSLDAIRTALARVQLQYPAAPRKLRASLSLTLRDAYGGPNATETNTSLSLTLYSGENDFGVSINPPEAKAIAAAGSSDLGTLVLSTPPDVDSKKSSSVYEPNDVGSVQVVAASSWLGEFASSYTSKTVASSAAGAALSSESMYTGTVHGLTGQLVRRYRLDIPNGTSVLTKGVDLERDKSTAYKLEVSVPWSFDTQLIKLYLPRVVSSDSALVGATDPSGKVKVQYTFQIAMNNYPFPGFNATSKFSVTLTALPPTNRPTAAPTAGPTRAPTSPSPMPTKIPTPDPSSRPTENPTPTNLDPTPEPTPNPTSPTPDPTQDPTSRPTPELGAVWGTDLDSGYPYEFASDSVTQVREAMVAALASLENLGPFDLAAASPRVGDPDALFGYFTLTLTGNAGSVPPLTVTAVNATGSANDIPLVSANGAKAIVSKLSTGTLKPTVQTISFQSSAALTSGSVVVVASRPSTNSHSSTTPLVLAGANAATEYDISTAIQRLPGMGLVGASRTVESTPHHRIVWTLTFATRSVEGIPRLDVVCSNSSQSSTPNLQHLCSVDGATLGSDIAGTSTDDGGLCTPLSSSLTGNGGRVAISIAPGTVGVSGSFRLAAHKLGTEDSSIKPGMLSIYALTTTLYPFDSPISLQTALGEAGLEARVYASACSTERVCSWAFSLSTPGVILVPVKDDPSINAVPQSLLKESTWPIPTLKGSEVKLFLTRDSPVATAIGSFKLVVTPGIGLGLGGVSTSYLPHGVGLEAIRSALLTATAQLPYDCGSGNLSCSIPKPEFKVLKSDVQGRFYVTATAKGAEFITNEGTILPLIAPTELPSLELGTLSDSNGAGPNSVATLTEVTAPKARRFLLTIRNPDSHADQRRDEVQAVSCSSRVPLLADGVLRSSSFQGPFSSSRLYPEMITISFRGFSRSLWIHSFITQPFNSTTAPVPLCSSLDNGYLAGKRCIDKSPDANGTLIDNLHLLASVAKGSVSVTTNSTTGRLCPSLSDVRAGLPTTFTTILTFSGSTGEAAPGKIKGASGDLPDVVITGSSAVVGSFEAANRLATPISTALAPLVSNATSTAFLVTELVKGRDIAISEVQIFSLVLDSSRPTNRSSTFPSDIDNSYHSSLGGEFTLRGGLDNSHVVVSATASESEFEAAVSRITQIPDVQVSRSPFSAESPLSAGGISWTVTFPVNAGIVPLLFADSHPCYIARPAVYAFSKPPSVLEADLWESSSGGCGVIVQPLTPSGTSTTHPPLMYPSVQFASRRVVSGVAPIAGSVKATFALAGAADVEVVSMPILRGLEGIQSALVNHPALKQVKVSSFVPATPGLENFSHYILDFVSAAAGREPELLDFDISGVRLSNAGMCARIQGLRENDRKLVPCQFPFVLGDGAQYSQCIRDDGHFLLTSGQGSTKQGLSFCSVVYHYAGTPGTYGQCEPCVMQGTFSIPPVTLVALSPTLRLAGDAISVAAALRETVFVPRSNADLWSSAGKGPLSSLIAAAYTFAPLIEQVSIITRSVTRLESGASLATLTDADVSSISVAVSIPAPFAPVRINTPSQIQLFEDALRVVPGISITPSGSPNSGQLYGLSMSVQFGDLFLPSHVGLRFAPYNVTGNLTFLGSARDINRALESLIYRPNEHVNAAVLGASLGSTSSGSLSVDSKKAKSYPRVQTFRTIVSGETSKDVQIIQTLITADSGDVSKSVSATTGHVRPPRGVILINDLDRSFFTLNVSCRAYAIALGARSLGPGSPHPSPALTAETNRLASNAEASVVKQEILSVFKACTDWMQRQAPKENAEAVAVAQSIVVEVNRVWGGYPENLADGSNMVRWEVSILSKVAAKLPLFKIARSHLRAATATNPSVPALDSATTVVAEVSVFRAPKELPSGSITFACNGQVSLPIMLGEPVETTIATLRDHKSVFSRCVNPKGLSVSLHLLQDPQNGDRIGYVYDLMIDTAADWIVDSATHLPVAAGTIAAEGDGTPNPDVILSVDASGVRGFNLFVLARMLPKGFSDDPTIGDNLGSGLGLTLGLGSKMSVYADVLSIVLTDLGQGQGSANGRGETLSFASVPVFTLPVEDVPILHFPFSDPLASFDSSGGNNSYRVITTEDESASLLGIQLLDVDLMGAVVQVTLSSRLGTLVPTGTKIGSNKTEDVRPEMSVEVTRGELETGNQQSLQIRGTAAGVSRLLRSIIFEPTADSCGNSSILITVELPGSLFARYSRRIPVEVLCVTDPITISVTTQTLGAEMNAIVKLGGISIANPDVVPSLRVVVESGRRSSMLHVPQLAELSYGDYTPANWLTQNNMTIDGPVGMINTMLRYISFSGIANDTIAINVFVTTSSAVVHGTSRQRVFVYSTIPSASAIINVTVYPTASPYALGLAPLTVVSVDEDSAVGSLPVSIRGTLLQGSLPDDAWLAQKTVIEAQLTTPMLCEAIMVADSGTLNIPEETGGASAHPAVYTVLSSGPMLHIRSPSFAALNSALALATYSPAANYNGGVFIHISIAQVGLPEGVSYSSSAPLILTGRLTVNVRPIDDPPVVRVRMFSFRSNLRASDGSKNSSALTDETETTFSLGLPVYTPGMVVSEQVLLRAFDASDLDDVYYLRVTVEAGKGKLGLLAGVDDSVEVVSTGTSGLGINSGSRFITFFAPISSITPTLDKVVYTPLPAYLGSDSVSVTLSSLIPETESSSGFTVVANASASFSFAVDSPATATLTCVQGAKLNEDDSFVMSRACDLSAQFEGSGIGEGAKAEVNLVFSAPRGAWTLAAVSEGASTVPFRVNTLVSENAATGLNAGSPILALSVDYAHVAALFDRVTFTPPLNFNGPMELSVSARVSVSSLGAVGVLSSSMQARALLPLSVLPINDPPIIAVALPDGNFSSLNASRENFLVLDAGQRSSIPLDFISVSDVDLSSQPGVFGLLELVVTAVRGRVAVSSRYDSYVAEDVAVSNSTGTNLTVLAASGASLTTFLAAGLIIYEPPINWSNITAQDTLILSVDDNGYSGAMPDGVPVGPVFMHLNVTVAAGSSPLLINTGGAVVTEEGRAAFLRGTVSIEGVDGVISALGGDSSASVASLYVSCTRGSISILADQAGIKVSWPMLQLVHSSNGFSSGALPVQSSKSSTSRQQRTLLITGALDAVASALQNVVYTPPPHTTLEVPLVLAMEFNGSWYNASHAVYITPFNDAPYFSGLFTVSVAQQHRVSLRDLDLMLSDDDLADSPLPPYSQEFAVKVSADCGLLELIGSPEQWALQKLPGFEDRLFVEVQGATFDESESCPASASSPPKQQKALPTGQGFAPLGYRVVNLRGDLTAINAFLPSIGYRAPLLFAGRTNIALWASDNGNFGLPYPGTNTSATDTSGSNTTTANINVTVTPSLKTAVSPISFAPSLPATGSLSFSIREGQPFFLSSVVTGVPDSALGSVSQKRMMTLLCSPLRSSSDLDNQIADASTIKDNLCTFSVGGSHPRISMSRSNSSIVFTGPFGALSAAAAATAVQPTDHFHGVIMLSLSIEADEGNAGAGISDSAGPFKAEGSIILKVNAVNEPPVITAPLTILLDEDASAALNVTVADPDMEFLLATRSPLLRLALQPADPFQLSQMLPALVEGSDAFLMQLNLTCQHCQFQDIATPRLTSQISLSASISDINRFLASNVSVRGDLDFNGAASMSLHLDDLGNFGTGGNLVALANVAINISAVNDPPALLLVSSEFHSMYMGVVQANDQNHDQDQGPALLRAQVSILVQQNASGSGDHFIFVRSHESAVIMADDSLPLIVDVDALPHEIFQLSLRCSHGELTLPLVSSDVVNGFRLVSGSILESPASSRSVKVEAELPALNQVLSAIVYSPDAGFSGLDTLTIKIADSSGAFSSSTFVMLCKASRLPPVLTVNGHPAVDSIPNSSSATTFPVIIGDENSIIHVDGNITVSDPFARKATATGRASGRASGSRGNRVNALVRASHRASLEIQTVRTLVHHVDQVHTIRIVPVAADGNVQSGNFTLMLDLSEYKQAYYQRHDPNDAVDPKLAKLAALFNTSATNFEPSRERWVVSTRSIQFDAVAMRVDELAESETGRWGLERPPFNKRWRRRLLGTDPTGQPSSQPSVQPSRQPTSNPSGQPSGQPSIQPSGSPSGQPTELPTSPTGQPSGQPSFQPTLRPDMGMEIGSSLQDVFESIPALAALGITVSASRLPNTLGFNSTESRSVTWEVTFHGSDQMFPVLTADSSHNYLSNKRPSLGAPPATSAGAGNIRISVFRGLSSNVLGGAFTLFLGNSQTVPLPHNATSAIMRQALERLPAVKAVGVQRSPPGLDGQYIWSVTFFATMFSESGLVPRLRADASQLTGAWFQSTATEGPTAQAFLPILPSVEVEIISKASGIPPVMAITSAAEPQPTTVTLSLRCVDQPGSALTQDVIYLNVSSPTANTGSAYAEDLHTPWRTFGPGTKGDSAPLSEKEPILLASATQLGVIEQMPRSFVVMLDLLPQEAAGGAAAGRRNILHFMAEPDKASRPGSARDRGRQRANLNYADASSRRLLESEEDKGIDEADAGLYEGTQARRKLRMCRNDADCNGGQCVNNMCVKMPSGHPTGQPSTRPTRQPSAQPSGSPTRQPTGQPTNPSGQPSGQPSLHPTRQPSGQPSQHPSGQPSRRPSRQPTQEPTTQPTVQPTRQPTNPTGQPSRQPSRQPTALPTSQPNRRPSSQPSVRPSGQPTGQPTNPTGQPTRQPSRNPTAKPTGQPSRQPTSQPSRQPTNPTGQPSRRPSGQPSRQPSRRPTAQPTRQPTRQPSAQPSRVPSRQPTRQPTRRPTGQPTRQPSRQPTRQPTGQPSRQPSAQPTNPTGQPTVQPSVPTGQPSRQPSAHPSSQPSSEPTSPTGQPSTSPTEPPGDPSGSRLPALYFYGPEEASGCNSTSRVPAVCEAFTGLYLSYYPSVDNVQIRSALPLPVGQWSTVRIAVDGVNGVMTLTVSGGVSMTASVPFLVPANGRNFTKVAVYASNPWQPAASAYIRNLRVYNSLLSNPTSPSTRRMLSIGPIYRDTVALVSDERNQYASRPQTVQVDDRVGGVQTQLHSLLEGTRRGQSMQALLINSGVLGEGSTEGSSALERVSVSRVAVAMQGFTVVSWTITFLDMPQGDPVVAVATVNAFPKGDVGGRSTTGHETFVDAAFGPAATRSDRIASKVSVAQKPANRIGGFFSLAFNGHTTPPLPIGATEHEVRAALMALQSVRDETLQLGDVLVHRHGPDSQGAYGWYVALTETTDDNTMSTLPAATEAYQLKQPWLHQLSLGNGSVYWSSGSGSTVHGSVMQVAGRLTGVGSRIQVQSLRRGPLGSGFRVGHGGTGGAASSQAVAGGDGEDARYESSLLLQGTPETVTAALGRLLFRPAPHWAGRCRLVVRVWTAADSSAASRASGDSAATNETVAIVKVDVRSVPSRPVVFFRGAKLSSS